MVTERLVILMHGIINDANHISGKSLYNYIYYHIDNFEFPSVEYPESQFLREVKICPAKSEDQQPELTNVYLSTSR